MRKIFLILTSFVLIVGLSGCIKINGGDPQNGNGTQDELTGEELTKIAKCLTEKGVKMYGAVWCSHCSNQKKAFGDAFQYINYIECDANTNLETAKICVEEGIEGVPAWDLPDGSRKAGETSPTELAELAGCL
ncbi:hypothetical protein C0416_02435 [bacterium]|nr:hypothetical protein [bacterium]